MKECHLTRMSTTSNSNSAANVSKILYSSKQNLPHTLTTSFNCRKRVWNSSEDTFDNSPTTTWCSLLGCLLQYQICFNLKTYTRWQRRDQTLGTKGSRNKPYTRSNLSRTKDFLESRRRIARDRTFDNSQTLVWCFLSFNGNFKTHRLFLIYGTSRE